MEVTSLGQRPQIQCFFKPSVCLARGEASMYLEKQPSEQKNLSSDTDSTYSMDHQEPISG